MGGPIPHAGDLLPKAGDLLPVIWRWNAVEPLNGTH